MARRAADGRPFLAAAGVVSLLCAAGVVPVWAGLLHHVAVPPLDLFADVRVLLARSTSYPAFVAQLVLVLLARSVLLAAALGDASRRRIAGALGFYAAALVPALLAGTLAFSALAVLYALFLWVAIAVVLVAAVCLAPVPWAGWGWVAHPRASLATIAAYVPVLLLLSALAAESGSLARVLLLWAAALLSAVVVRRLASPPRTPRHRPPAALMALLVVALAAPTVPGLVDRMGGGDRSLFLVAGVGTRSGSGSLFELDPRTIGFPCERTYHFSYAGPGDGAPRRESACPIRSGAPYEKEDTQRPLDELVVGFRRQLAEVPGPVVVVAHSQAGWIARAGLGRGGLANVTSLVLLAPFPTHALEYVPAGGRGRGTVGSDAMRALLAGIRAIGHTSFDPEAPLARELLTTVGAVEELMRDGARHPARTLAVTTWVDLPVMPNGWQTPGAVDACPVPIWHGDLFTASSVAETVQRFLAGEPVGDCPWWRRWLPAIGAAFTVPTEA